MGTASPGQNVTQSGSTSSEVQRTGGRIGSPITNEAYDVLTALQSKLEGLEAYRKYAKNGNAELWQSLSDSEMEAVGKLCDELERMVQQGMFRMREPGRGNA